MVDASERGSESWRRYIELPNEGQRLRPAPQLFFNSLLKLSIVPKKKVAGVRSERSSHILVLFSMNGFQALQAIIAYLRDLGSGRYITKKPVVNAESFQHQCGFRQVRPKKGTK
jgi:hypothetical protein